MTSIGDKYHDLEVVELLSQYVSPNGVTKNRYRCICICGNYIDVLGNSLTVGNTKSCGCLKLRTSRIRGKGKSKEYRTWFNMKNRIKTKQSYSHVSVCERWSESEGNGFLNFLEDMGEVPDGMSLDRIDPNGNYEPSNCRWAVISTQSLNKRGKPFNLLGIRGVSKATEDSWNVTITVNKKRRVKRFKIGALAILWRIDMERQYCCDIIQELPLFETILTIVSTNEMEAFLGDPLTKKLYPHI